MVAPPEASTPATPPRLLKTLPSGIGDIVVVAFSPAGELVAIGGYDKAIRVVDIRSGREVFRYSYSDFYGRSTSKFIRGLNFSGDGRTLTAWSWTGWLVQIDIPSGKITSSMPLPGGEALALSANRNWLAVRWSTGVKVVDVASGRPGVERKGTVWLAALSPNGSLLATEDPQEPSQVVLWDTVSEQVRATMSSPGPVISMTFSADGRQLAVVGCRGVIIFNVATGQQRILIEGARGNAAFSPDGQWLASGNLAGTVKLWDVATGREHLELAAPLRGGLVFSADGTRLAVWEKSQVTIWDVKPGADPATRPGNK